MTAFQLVLAIIILAYLWFFSKWISWNILYMYQISDTEAEIMLKKFSRKKSNQNEIWSEIFKFGQTFL
jgi:hypothetical protein